MKIFFDFLPLLLFFGVGKYADNNADWAARFATEHFGFMVSGGVVGTEEASALLATIVVILATGVQIGWLLSRGKKVDMMLWVTFFRKNLLQTLIGEQLQLPAPVWQRLNLAWIAFFALLGLLNLYVAYTFSTSTWFTFKAFGVTGLMLVFMLAQGLYISKHMAPEADAEPAPAPERLP